MEREHIKDKALRINVIGAGLAGLSAARQLIHKGHEVSIFEARDRVGGRVHTARGGLMPVETGGEFIADEHTRWHELAKEYGLGLSPIASARELPLMYRGEQMSSSRSDEIRDVVEKALAVLPDMAAKIDLDEPWKSPNAEALDRTSVAEWARQVVPQGGLELSALTSYIEMINAVPADRQSLLGQLVQVGGEAGDDPNSFGSRCSQGNDALPRAMADEIIASGSGHIHLLAPVSGLETATGTVILHRGHRHKADAVVLAIPPSLWSHLNIDVPWPHPQLPQMGLATKVSIGFDRSLPQKPIVTQNFDDDLIIWGSWSVASKGDRGIASMTGFFPGFPYEPSQGSAFERFAGSGHDISHTVHTYDWQKEQYTKGGYPFPALGEITTWGPTWSRPMGRMYFAGDCTEYTHVGYMEGAIRSGEKAARRIIQHLA